MNQTTWIVIAENYHQSENARVARGVSRSRWIYTGHLGTLQGRLLTEDQILTVGDWWKRPDLGRIMEEIGARMIRTTTQGER